MAAAAGPNPAVGATTGQCGPVDARGSGPVNRIHPTLCAAFKLARRRQSRSDLPPFGLRPWMMPQGINPRLGRRARVLKKQSVYLLPGRRNSCLYFGRTYGGFICKSHRKAAQGELQLVDTGRRDYKLAQLLPDGARKVRLRVDGIRTRSLRVRGNAIVASGRPPAVGAVTWTDSRGRHRTPFRAQLPGR